jgi:hypothetical protein
MHLSPAAYSWQTRTRLQAWLAIPLAASTQWQLLSEGTMSLAPVWEKLTDQAAQGKILFIVTETAATDRREKRISREGLASL